jgi:AraC-like DNA-binding protein
MRKSIIYRKILLSRSSYSTISNMIESSLDPVGPSQERRSVDFRDYGMNDLLVLGRYDYTFAHQQLPTHSHGYIFEFCLLDEGIQPFTVLDREYTLRGGEILVIRPFEQHGSGQSPENRGRLYWFQIRVPRNGESFLNLSADEAGLLTRSLYTISDRHFKVKKSLKHYLDHIFKATERKDDLMVLEIRNWALRFLLDVIEDNRNHASTRISPKIRRIISCIESRLNEENINLTQIAEVAGLSLSHFKARFKQEVGLAPGNFITLRKIEGAKKTLIETDLPVTRVAMEYGFSSSQYFSTTFKRYTGCTPSEYREQRVQ